MAVTCNNIKQGSLAERAGIKPSDRIITINNEKIADVFDYDFHTTEETLVIIIESGSEENPHRKEIEIQKEQYEDLGIEFDTYMIDCEKSCRNKCIFCFIDQNPKGMRDNLYFKDDDTRLSFLTGSYATLTNIDDKELHRIVKYKLSPINISVHTTNPELRIKMLNNRFAGDILRKIRILTEGNIQVNCQIVLCKNVNDGEELERSLGDLLTLIPHINSISIVPVGITKYREGLYPMEPFTKEDSAKLIEIVEKWQDIFIAHMQSRVVFAADEFYVKAEINTPDYEKYEEFPQLENGVGMLTLLEKEVREELNERKDKKTFFKRREKPRKITIATGECAYKVISRLASLVTEKYPHIEVKVLPVKNNFYGGEVTVTGLLTGEDLIQQLGAIEKEELGSEILLSNDMFKDDGDLLLDGITAKEIESALDIKVIKVYNSGYAFIDAIYGRNSRK